MMNGITILKSNPFISGLSKELSMYIPNTLSNIILTYTLIDIKLLNEYFSCNKGRRRLRRCWKCDRNFYTSKKQFSGILTNSPWNVRYCIKCFPIILCEYSNPTINFCRYIGSCYNCKTTLCPHKIIYYFKDNPISMMCLNCMHNNWSCWQWYCKCDWQEVRL